MLPYADLALYNNAGRLIAVVEVKNKPGTSREWAAQLRSNVLAHGGFRSSDFFLLITPDKLYVWKDAGIKPAVITPTYVVDAQPILKPYFEAAHIEPAAINGPTFELVVGAWLGDLIRSESKSSQVSSTSEDWLTESGLLDAVKNGRVEYEAAA
jgi:hypothetical protein